MDADKRAWIWGGIAIAAGIGLVVTLSDVRRDPASPKRVLLIGDSLAEGLSVPLRALVEGQGALFRADGRSGTTIGDWARANWLGDLLTSFGPDLVLVSLGTSDMRLGDPTTEAPLVRALVARAEAAGAEVVWLEPPDMPFADGGVRQMVTDEAPEVFPSDALDIARGPDDIHPTAKGYAGWAGAIWRWLGASDVS